jgi:hypothetical protein
MGQKGETPNARYGHNFFKFKDYDYLVGGRDFENIYNDIYKIKIVDYTLKWERLKIKGELIPRYFFRSILDMNFNKILFVGGK